MKQFSLLLTVILASSASAFVPPSQPTSSSSALFSNAVDDKTEVREYFNTEGFNRWNKIYSESDDVNKVQLDIRTGHDMTIQKILNWVQVDGDIQGKTVCDCGCGVGSLAIPLAQMGEFFNSPCSLRMIASMVLGSLGGILPGNLFDIFDISGCRCNIPTCFSPFSCLHSRNKTKFYI